MVWNEGCGKFPQLSGAFHTFSTVLELDMIFYSADL